MDRPRVTCECGVQIMRQSMPRHLKSKKHSEIMGSKKPITLPEGPVSPHDFYEDEEDNIEQEDNSNI